MLGLTLVWFDSEGVLGLTALFFALLVLQGACSPYVVGIVSSELYLPEYDDQNAFGNARSHTLVRSDSHWLCLERYVQVCSSRQIWLWSSSAIHDLPVARDALGYGRYPGQSQDHARTAPAVQTCLPLIREFRFREDNRMLDNSLLQLSRRVSR